MFPIVLALGLAVVLLSMLTRRGTGEELGRNVAGAAKSVVEEIVSPAFDLADTLAADLSYRSALDNVTAAYLDEARTFLAARGINPTTLSDAEVTLKAQAEGFPKFIPWKEMRGYP